MAASRPVIATAAGIVPELAIDGETGILIPPQDTQALAQSILRLASNPEIGQ